MFGGGGGMNPRKMKQMMNQMGIDLTEIDAEEVIIRTEDTEYVFHDADVQRMDAQGQQTYQVIGEPDERPRGEDASAVEAGGDEADDGDAAGSGAEFTDQDVQIVTQRAGVSEDAAREALAETGDLAAAIQRLEDE
jgi:nascent polypeptide-associated complex subunit alpha